MQILEASLQEPSIEQEVRHHLDTLFVVDFVRSKSIDRHLVDAFAELADRIRNYGDAFEHLTRDCVDNIEQLDEHLLVEGLLALSFHVPSTGRQAKSSSTLSRLGGRILIGGALVLLSV